MRFIFFISNGSKRAREAILVLVGVNETGVPFTAHRSSTAKSRNTRFLFLLLHQLIDGSRREKVFYVFSLPVGHGVPNVEPEARLVLGEGVRFLPGKPETLENAFYLQLELELERFRVVVEPELGHLDNGKTAINGRSTIGGGLGPLAWHCVAGAWWKTALARLSLL